MLHRNECRVSIPKTVYVQPQCFHCNPTHPYMDLTIIKDLKWTFQRLPTKRPGDSLPCLSVTTTAATSRCLYSRQLSSLPPADHFVVAESLNTSNTSFMLLLGDVNVSINMTAFFHVSDMLFLQALIEKITYECFRLGIYIKPTKLAIQTRPKDLAVFTSIESTIPPSTIFVGQICHKFILPVKVTGFERLYSDDPFSKTIVHVEDLFNNRANYVFNPWPVLPPRRSSIGLHPRLPQLILPEHRDSPMAMARNLRRYQRATYQSYIQDLKDTYPSLMDGRRTNPVIQAFKETFSDSEAT